MMANREQSEQADVLSDIYAGGASDSTSLESSKPRQRSAFVDRVTEYFQEPGTVERWLAGGIFVFGMVGVVFGVAHLGSSIGDPLMPFIPEKQFDLAGSASGQIADRSKDTDQDGLSDFDELEVYGTSPYLQDTDSDGISDQQELAQNSDPTCPRGQNCFGIGELDDLPLDSGASNAQLLNGQTSPAELRALLEGAGFSSNQVDQLSDQQISQLYNDALQNVSGQASGEATFGQPQVTIPSTEELTPERIRELLLAEGVAQSTLDQITDAELLQLAEETLQEIE